MIYILNNCCKCGTELNNNNWYDCNKRKHWNICNPCKRNSYKVWRDKNRVRYNIKSRNYYADHKSQVRETVKRWRDNNPEKWVRIYKYGAIERKNKIIEHYSNSTMKCSKCGISDIRVLSIDHIKGKGNKHRKEVGCGANLYNWIIKNNFPDGFQVLCMNCQFIKRHENNEWSKKIDANIV